MNLMDKKSTEIYHISSMILDKSCINAQTLVWTTCCLAQYKPVTIVCCFRNAQAENGSSEETN